MLRLTEQANALDFTNATNYVIVVVVENGDAVDVYYSAPIFNSSEKVWHVSPRQTYWRVEKRLDYWELNPRETNWNVEQRNDFWTVSPRQDYWTLNE